MRTQSILASFGNIYISNKSSVATIFNPILHSIIIRPLSEFGVDWPSIDREPAKSRRVYRRRKLRHGEMVFVVVERCRRGRSGRAISRYHEKMVWAIVVSQEAACRTTKDRWFSSGLRKYYTVCCRPHSELCGCYSSTWRLIRLSVNTIRLLLTDRHPILFIFHRMRRTDILLISLAKLSVCHPHIQQPATDRWFDYIQCDGQTCYWTHKRIRLSVFTPYL